VGFFYFGSRQSALETGRYEAFVHGMRERGYVEGQHFVLEARFADGKPERLAALAAELVRLKVDVLVVTGTPAHLAARQATASIPIVVTLSVDPVGEGWAASLARPGGNMTGVSAQNTDTIVKSLDLLMTVLPKLSRVAVLMNPANAAQRPLLHEVQTATAHAGVEVLPVDGGTVEAIEHAFSTMAHWRADAVITLGDTFFAQERQRIAGLALQYRLP
jgi:putative ABC transport system substrate-binding protein